MFRILTAAKFSCTRTCTPDTWCKFRPILEAIGSTKVVSHTVKVTVELKNRAALAAAVLKMGGTVQGEKARTHRGSGYAFTLPNWYDILVLQGDNTLAYDADNDYSRPEILQKLKGQYAVEAARIAADEQGWASYDESDGGLTITHPSGGQLTVAPDGTVDAIGFIGSACDIASVIEEAIGTPGTRDFKPEYYQQGGLRV